METNEMINSRSFHVNKNRQIQVRFNPLIPELLLFVISRTDLPLFDEILEQLYDGHSL